jgi:cell wall-associated NlpC family hydrolase
MRIRTTLKRRACALALALALGTAVMGVPAAYATPVTGVGVTTDLTAPTTTPAQTTVQTKQAAVAALQTRLDTLYLQMEQATEDWDAAQQALGTTQQQLTASKSDLAQSQAALDVQTNLLAQRAEAIYRDGAANNAAILLSSKSIPDFLDRMTFVTTISSADANLASELSSQRDQIASKERDLENASLKAQSLEFTARSRKIEIQYEMQDVQKLLGSAQADVRTALNNNSLQRAAQSTTLVKNILTGAKDMGVSVVPGSPVETILSYVGIPYVWGGASPSGFDCSGLTMYVMAQHGVNLPHHAADQYLMGTPVSSGNLQAGDLVFFGSPIHHVGMYIGGGYFVEAPHTGADVRVSKLAGRSDMVGARRYAWRYRVGPPRGVGKVSIPAGL